MTKSDPDRPCVQPPPAPAPIRCAECGRGWVVRDDHWRAYVATIDGIRVVGLFCSQCAAREFDDD